MDRFDELAEDLLECVDYDIYKEDLEERYILNELADRLRSEFKD